MTTLACMYCGLPIGGAVAGLVAALASSDWRYVFYIGGLGPLLLAPVLARYLSSAPRVHRHDASDSSTRSDLEPFRLAHAVDPAALDGVVLPRRVLLNWLPSLARGRGYSHAQASTSAIVLNCGAVIGSLLLGYLSDRRRPTAILSVTYFGMIVSLLVLATPLPGTFLLGAFGAGFFVIGGQLVLYAIAPTLYPPSVSGTGVGAAVAAGRTGSIVGPLIGGSLLASGFDRASCLPPPSLGLPSL